MAKRDVQIEISAKDRTAAGLKSAESALKRFQNAQQATQARRSAFAGAEKDARDLYKAYQDAGDAAQTLGRKMGDAKRPSTQLKTEFAAAREEVRRTKVEFMAASVAFGKLNGRVASGGGSFAQFDRTVDALRSQTVAANQTGAALEALARDLPKVAAAQQRVKQETEQATRALNAQGTAGRGRSGGIASKELDALTSAKGRGILGLRPYEVQNLSYQINDLFTQIASGTPITQAFAQQGGQIAQLFPQAALGILRMIPVIALVTAAIAPFVSALIDVQNKAASLKAFDIALTASGNGANYTKERLADLATTLDGLGGSLADARAALNIFVGDAVEPAYLERFGKAAINLAKVLKIDVTDAAKQVSTAFTGNISDILSLDDSITFLTKSERAQIEALKKSGKEAEARTLAFAIFERRYDETAAKMRGPWSNILSNFGDAWKAFADYVNFIDFSKVKEEINGLIKLIEDLTSKLPGARTSTFARTGTRITELQQQLSDSEALSRQLQAGGGTEFQRNAARAYQARIRRDIAYQRVRQAGQSLVEGIDPIARPGTPTDTTTRPPAVPTTRTPRSGGQSDLERLAIAQKEFNEDLDAANAKRTFEIGLIGQTSREAQILTTIEEARSRAADAGLQFTEAQTESIRESVAAAYDAQRAFAGNETVQRASLALAERRGEVETEEAFIQRGLKEAGLEAIEETNAATTETTISLTRQSREYANILRQQYQMDTAARDREASEKAVNDLMTERAELQNQLTFAQEQGDQGASEALIVQLDAVNARLLQVIRSAIELARSLGGPNAAAIILAWEGIAKQLESVGQKAIVTGQDINNMLAQGGVNALDRFAQQVVETGKAFGALRDAFLQFAADFLREIAQIIAKRALLNLVEKGGGKDGGIGGAIASFIGRLFHTGGVVGQGGGSTRRMSPIDFAGALRYHGGGVAGFKPNEVPAILEKGEEVLTADDPRHRGNAKGGGGATTVVNVFDPADFLDRALSGEGGQILLNHVSRNSGAFKAAMG
ncbi:phage tail length tape measure family protein [Brevundimonas sp. SL161]|uniref:phage tail length tape measure family protein n=1 Tax=Brevundimonas sp. SL161 TaxID=2804613 RepID=UPI003CF04FD2